MENKNEGLIITIFCLLVILFIGGLMFLVPHYSVWRREMVGKAQLREAEWSKKIAVEEARAKNDSATLQAEAMVKQETAKAEAEIIRAKGLAESQKIISETLSEPYLRYLWINKIEEGSNKQTIYIPTEAGVPINEAGNR